MRLTPFTRVPSVALLAVALATLSGCGGQAPATSSISAKRGALEVISRSHGCPSNDFRLKASANPATARMLVPAHPTGALICRYLNPEAPGYRGRGLAGVLTVASSAALGRIVARLDALPPYPVRPAPSCPTFGGRSVLILFHYRHVSDDPVRILAAGCIPVSNGRLVKFGLGGVKLTERHWPDEGLL